MSGFAPLSWSAAGEEVFLGRFLNVENGAILPGCVPAPATVKALYLLARDLLNLVQEPDEVLARTLSPLAVEVLGQVGRALGDPCAQPAEVAAFPLPGLVGHHGGTVPQLAERAAKLAELLQAEAEGLHGWGALPAGQRPQRAARLVALAREATEAAERCVTPLPSTDVCVCRTCKRVLLPTRAFGTALYRCCGRSWMPDPRAGYGPLRADFWQRYAPGDRCGIELAPDLDALGRPTAVPAA